MDVARLLALSAIVMCASHTIARERIFAPLRRALGGFDTWPGYLVSCPYCSSHWIAFALAWAARARFVGIEVGPAWVRATAAWFLSSILIVAVAATMRVAFYLVDQAQKWAKEGAKEEREDG